MFLSNARRAIALTSLTFLAACASSQDVSRSEVLQTIGAPRALTMMTRQFIAETPYTVHFEFDSAALDAEARARLARQAAWISAHPEIRFSVYGHADRVGSEVYNLQLGLVRAQTVVRYLIGLGVDGAQLDILSSLGEIMPVVETERPERMNRRATTYVAGLVAERPGNASRILARRVNDDKPPKAEPPKDPPRDPGKCEWNEDGSDGKHTEHECDHINNPGWEHDCEPGRGFVPPDCDRPARKGKKNRNRRGA